MWIKHCLWLLVIALWCSPSFAATQTASSVSRADVLTAYNAASSGDTVAIPSGTATWTSPITIDKAVTVQGAGSSSTVITGTAGQQIFHVDFPTNIAVRITGIGFVYSATTNNGSYAIYLHGNQGDFAVTSLRIDNCSFTKGNRGLYFDGWFEALADHNTFTNIYNAILFNGDNNYSWERDIEAGTSHALFIEDNTFVVDNNADMETAEAIMNQYGARTVFRYNNLNYENQTSRDSFFIDVHGNQNDYYSSGDPTRMRGEPIIEIYNNHFHAHHSYRSIYMRGGSLLFHNNAIIYTSGTPTVVLTEQEGWSGSNFPTGLRSSWPAEDQYANTFFWNNTINGSAMTSISLQDAADSTFIQEDRDYFMHSPAATGGKTSYTGTRKGGSASAPTTSSTANTTFSASGANAYYPYTAYTYPHPSQGGVAASPSYTGSLNGGSIR